MRVSAYVEPYDDLLLASPSVRLFLFLNANIPHIDSRPTRSAAEFGVVARAFGAQVSDEELEEIISELNVSGGGTIDFLDFCGLMVRQYSDQRDPEFTAAFHAIDADGDGTLSPEELRDAFAALGYEFNEVEIAEMASEADADGDGRLTLSDFMFNCKSS